MSTDTAQFKPITVTIPEVLEGKYITLKKITSEDGPAICEVLNATPGCWDYLPYGPFESLEAFDKHHQEFINLPNAVNYVIYSNDTSSPVGTIGLQRFDYEHGVTELAHLRFSYKMQRTVGSTEASYLLIKWAMDNGFRRVEWKCNSRNIPSHNAALRLGFTYEGTFRNHMFLKGANRDSDWFSIIGSEWPQLDAAFQQWLSADNFVDGKQVKGLKELRE